MVIRHRADCTTEYKRNWGYQILKAEELGGSNVLNYYGLVTAPIKKLEIAKHLAQPLPLTSRAKTTDSQHAGVVILNSLGFMDD